MKQSTKKAYEDWAKEVEGGMPESLRANWRALAESDAGFGLYNGHLRQQEFDRALNDVKTAEKQVLADRQALTEVIEEFKGDVERARIWYEEEAPKNKRLAEEYQKLYSQYQLANRKLNEFGLVEDTPMPQPGAQPVPQSVSNEVLEELKALKQRLAIQDRAIPKVLTDAITVVKEGLKEGFEFDPNELMNHATRNGVDLRTAFQAITHDQREKKQAAEREKELEKAREEGRREAFSKNPSPERMGPIGPSPIDTVLSGRVPSSQERVAAATKAFMENPNITTTGL